MNEILKKHRQQILDLAARHGAENIRVFGSVARGEDDIQSDVDILIDLKTGRTLLDHAALILELEELLGCKVDVITENSLRPKIRARVLGEALAL